MNTLDINKQINSIYQHNGTIKEILHIVIFLLQVLSVIVYVIS
jgi:hypothetical protein